jgi:hypothetical protein
MKEGRKEDEGRKEGKKMKTVRDEERKKRTKEGGKKGRKERTQDADDVQRDSRVHGVIGTHWRGGGSLPSAKVTQHFPVSLLGCIRGFGNRFWYSGGDIRAILVPYSAD